MRLTPVERLEAGDVLAAEVAGEHPAIPLLRADVRLTDGAIARLRQLGITSVWVHDAVTSDLPAPEPLRGETRARAAGAVLAAFADVRRAAERKQPLSQECVDELTAVVEQVVADLGHMPDAAIALRNLASADAYTHHHCVNVCVIGLLVAREHFRRHGWVGWQGERHFDGVETRLRMLGLGLLLHDIGKALVPPDVLHKPGRLDDEEWKAMRRHTDLGAHMLSAAVVPAPAIAVVRDHHERCDGSGYGAGKAGGELHEFARIAGIADTFDAITAERPYKAARPPADAVAVIEQGGGTLFDKAMVESFSRVVAPYPLGTEMQLDDGRVGVVVRVDMDDPWHPVVRAREAGGGIVEFETEPAPAHL